MVHQRNEGWGGLLDDWRHSGKSVAAYCRKAEISIWKFHYWKKKLGTVGNFQDQGKFVRLSVSDCSDSSSGLWIELSPGIRLVIESGFKSEDLFRVLQTVGGRKC